MGSLPGAALGLVLVTMIGVLFGGVLMKYIPPLYMRLGAAFLFIGIGLYFVENMVELPNSSYRRWREERR